MRKVSICPRPNKKTFAASLGKGRLFALDDVLTA
jgi:hypothetical protein